MRRVSFPGLLCAGLLLVGCKQESPKPVGVRTNTTGEEGKPGASGSETKSETVDDTQSGPSQTQTGEKKETTPTDNSPIPSGPTTTAVTVAAGPVSFDLASAKPALAGASLSATLAVNAARGSAPASISLSDFAVKTPDATGIVLYRPVLVLTENGKETQYPIGTNINLKVPKARTVPLAGLTSVPFENIAAGASIKLRFSALEPQADALLDGIPNYRECKAPQNFKAVADALVPCEKCHGGGYFIYDFMAKDMATACGQNLKIIDRTLSSTGTIPNIPAGAHQGVNAGPVRAALGPWRTAEGL